jgi:hypothetical protein
VKNRKAISIFLLIFLIISVNPKILRGLEQEDSWIRIWDSGYMDECQGMAIDTFDNVYIVGNAFNDDRSIRNTYLLKYSSGNLIWEKYWSNFPSSRVSAICTDSLFNVYITGFTNSQGSGDSDIFILKYNSSGELLWNHTWDGGKEDRSSAIAVDSLDNIYIGGINTSGDTGYDVLLLKYNSSGDLQLNCTWRDIYDEFCHGLAIDSLDNLYMSYFTLGYEQILGLVKCNIAGEFQWNQTWNQPWDNDEALCVVDSIDNIIVKNSYLLTKFNNNGTKIWSTTEYGKVIRPEGITLDPQDNIYITGYYLGGCNNSMSITCTYTALDIYNSSLILEDKKLCYKSDSEGRAIAFNSLGDLYIAGVTWTSSRLKQDIVLLKNPTDYVEDDAINYDFILWIVVFGGCLCAGTIVYLLIISKYKKRKE